MQELIDETFLFFVVCMITTKNARDSEMTSQTEAATSQQNHEQGRDLNP